MMRGMGGERDVRRGFTVAELLIVIVVLVILATVVVVGYQGVQERSALSAVKNTLREAQKAVLMEAAVAGTLPTALPGTFAAHDDIRIEYRKLAVPYYLDMSPIQNGVLLHSICVELMSDSYYTTIHPREGDGVGRVFTGCDDGTLVGRLMITGWDSRSWEVPVEREDFERYIAQIPHDDWWVDRREVVGRFYETLLARFEASGGMWPITSFWDGWANSHAGVRREELPLPDEHASANNYCIEASHRRYGGKTHVVHAHSSDVKRGRCA